MIILHYQQLHRQPKSRQALADMSSSMEGGNAMTCLLSS